MLLDYSLLVKENGAITTQHVTASSPHSAKEQYKKAHPAADGSGWKQVFNFL